MVRGPISAFLQTDSLHSYEFCLRIRAFRHEISGARKLIFPFVASRRGVCARLNQRLPDDRVLFESPFFPCSASAKSQSQKPDFDSLNSLVVLCRLVKSCSCVGQAQHRQCSVLPGSCADTPFFLSFRGSCRRSGCRSFSIS